MFRNTSTPNLENEINHALDTYGEKWILRDFDFYPEKLSDLCKMGYQEPYMFKRCVEQKNRNEWLVFDTEREAIGASLGIREMLGLKENSHLKEKAERIELEDAIKRAKDTFKRDFGKDIEITIK